VGVWDPFQPPVRGATRGLSKRAGRDPEFPENLQSDCMTTQRVGNRGQGTILGRMYSMGHEETPGIPSVLGTLTGTEGWIPEDTHRCHSVATHPRIIEYKRSQGGGKGRQQGWGQT